MIKKAFTWFFCNLYYFYAKKKHRDSDRVILFTVGGWIFILFGIFVAIPLSFIPHIKLTRETLYMPVMLSLIVYQIIFYRLFYKNGYYKKLLEGFDESRYDKLIIVYTILICVGIPLGLGLLMHHLLAR